MKRINMIVLLVLLLFPMLSACSEATTPTPTATTDPTATATSQPDPPALPTNTPVPEPTATAPAPTDMPISAQKVDVGGYSLYISCKGEGDITVVLESGQIGDRTVWSPLMKLNPTNLGVKVCIYDHAGIGSSDRPLEVPRTVADMTRDLHALLSNAKIPGPYILVGLDSGAYIARYYTDLYPDEVAGILMLNEAHPENYTTIEELIPPPEEDESPGLAIVRDFIAGYTSDVPLGTEQILLQRSAEMALEIEILGDVPLVILWRGVQDRQAQIDWWTARSYIDEDLIIEIEDALTELTRELTTLSTNSTFIIAEGTSGAYFVNSATENILEALRLVVEQVREE